jgi:hypothetical protein
MRTAHGLFVYMAETARDSSDTLTSSEVDVAVKWFSADSGVEALLACVLSDLSSAYTGYR